MAQVVFLTVFLGLTAGTQTVALSVRGAVSRVRLELDGTVVARLEGEPWTARVDFGAELRPHALVAVGEDSAGSEVTRASSMLNVAPPGATVDLVLSADGEVKKVEVVGHHRLNREVRHVAVSADGEPLRVERDRTAQLPKLDRGQSHLVSAEVRFADGEVARKDLVLEGGFSELIESELTPLLVTVASDRASRGDGCFLLDGVPVRVSAVEQGDALVTFVKDPDPREIMRGLRPRSTTGDAAWQNVQQTFGLERETQVRFVWPVPDRFSAEGEATSVAYPRSNDVRAADYEGSFQYAPIAIALMQSMRPLPSDGALRSYADAVAVAAMGTAGSGRRGAVVLVLSSRHDSSRNRPEAVRRYLQRLGVPLFVWSAGPPPKDAREAWRTIEDVARPAGLEAAAERVNAVLRRQQIAWVATDPLSALRVTVKKECGYSTTAGQGR